MSQIIVSAIRSKQYRVVPDKVNNKRMTINVRLDPSKNLSYQKNNIFFKVLFFSTLRQPGESKCKDIFREKSSPNVAEQVLLTNVF